MPRLFPGNVRVGTGRCWSGALASWLALLECVGIVLGNPVLAEGDDPGTAGPADAPAATLVPPTEPPSPPTFAPTATLPTEPPPPPAEAPTEAPAPTAVITATSAPDLPTAPAVEPTATAGPTHPPATIDDTLACPTADATDIGPGTAIESPCAAPGSANAEPGTELPPCPPTVSATGNSLDFGASAWNGVAYPPAAGALTLAIAATGSACSGLAGNWNIQVSALDMTSADGAHTIPPTSLTYTGSSSSAVPPAGIAPASGPAPLDSARTIASTTASDSTGGSWSVAFVLSPPADAPPGVYTDTIVIDVVAAGSD